jgi:hypothetical protein
MFNNWFKFKYFKNEKIFSNSSRFFSNWSNNIPIFVFSYNKGRVVYRVFHTYFFPSPTSYLKMAENPTQFFRDYADHSKKILSIIKDGYGRKNPYILGSIEGFTINKYQEPKMSFLELAKRHLISGYSDTWDLIIANQSISEGILYDLEGTQEEFKEIIISKIDDEFHLDDNPDLLSNDTENTYYENLFSEIYNEMTIRNNNESRHLLRGSPSIRKRDGHIKNYSTLYFTYDPQGLDTTDKIVIAIGDERSIETLQGNILGLLDSSVLNQEFREFNDKRDSFYKMNKENIYSKIDNIYSTAIRDPLNLKGKCPLCPPHSRIDIF